MGKKSHQTKFPVACLNAEKIPALECQVSQSFVVGKGCKDQVCESLGVRCLEGILLGYSAVLAQILEVVWVVLMVLEVIVLSSADAELYLPYHEARSLNQGKKVVLLLGLAQWNQMV